MKDSDLLFIPVVSPPAISFARSASISLVPIGRLHSSRKYFLSPAWFKKITPWMRSSFNFLRSSPLRSVGNFCWIQSNSLSASHFFISSIVGFVWLACSIYVLEMERIPWRLIGRRDVDVTSEVERRDGE